MNAIAEAAAYLGEARRIQGQAKAEVDAALAQAQQQGYQAGYADGRRAALEDLSKGVAEARERVILSESDLVGIVITALERMLGQSDQEDLARRCLRQALADAAGELWAVVRVSAEQHAMFTEDLASLGQDAGHPPIKSVEADPLLRAGEIMLETPKGRIHVGLRQQMARLQSGLQQLDG
jgi:flagellar biosynthesis/type III secretory pathway protein FliH